MARASGQTTIDFGAFPGTSHVSLNIASSGVEVGSLVEAWLSPVATNDHSVDEHLIAGPRVYGCINSPGVGITVHAVGRSDVPPPPGSPGPDYYCFAYGLWTVEWVHT